MKQIFTSNGITLPFKGCVNTSILKNKDVGRILIDLSAFTYLHLKSTKNIGDTVLKGETIAYEIHLPERVYLSSASGKIVNILRGERRKITGIEIEIDKSEKSIPLSFSKTDDKESLMKILFEKGLSFFIHKRPFQRLIKRNDIPRSIFINTVVSAPYAPSFTFILKDNEEIFKEGISILSKLAPVHLIYNEKEFSSFSDCSSHEARGLHPIESPSIHIMAIDPITSVSDIVWTLDVYDVLQIGSVFSKNSLFTDKIIALAGLGFNESDRILIKTSKGARIKDISPEVENTISGDPLTGLLGNEFIREKDFVVTGFITEEKKELIPFMKPGLRKFTATNTYLGGFFKGLISNKNLKYKLGGEERPFILKDIYQKTLPLNIYIEPLIKALLAKDYSQAISLGFLEIDSKDLALAEYICPSKIPLMKAFEDGKKNYLLLQDEN